MFAKKMESYRKSINDFLENYLDSIKNKIENNLRIHAGVKHMVHFFTFHLLHTPFSFKHPFSGSKHSQLTLHVIAVLARFFSSVTENIGPR